QTRWVTGIGRRARERGPPASTRRGASRLGVSAILDGVRWLSLGSAPGLASDRPGAARGNAPGRSGARLTWLLRPMCPTRRTLRHELPSVRGTATRKPVRVTMYNQVALYRR